MCGKLKDNTDESLYEKTTTNDALVHVSILHYVSVSQSHSLLNMYIPNTSHECCRVVFTKYHLNKWICGVHFRAVFSAVDHYLL